MVGEAQGWQGQGPKQGPGLPESAPQDPAAVVAAARIWVGSEARQKAAQALLRDGLPPPWGKMLQ